MNQNTLAALEDILGDATEPRGHAKQLKLAADNDYFTKGELTPQMRKLLESIAGRGIEEVVRFCFLRDAERRGEPAAKGPPPLDEKSLKYAMRRFVAVTWLMHSEFLVDKAGEPLSLKALGTLPQLSCTKCLLSLLAQRFGKLWKFRTRVQKRVTSKPTYAASAKTGWAKRRAREEAASAEAVMAE